MEQVYFSFENRACQGTLFSSREKKPFFYWCYFEDAELVHAVGECVGFVDKDGEIKTTETFPTQYQPVIDDIKLHILQSFYRKEPYKA